jgi:hypothetical protein
MVQHCAAGRGDSRQALAAALEDRQTQLLLEHADLLGHARLRGKQRFGGGIRDIQAAPLHFDQVTQLLQLHGPII